MGYGAEAVARMTVVWAREAQRTPGRWLAPLAGYTGNLQSAIRFIEPGHYQVRAGAQDANGKVHDLFGPNATPESAGEFLGQMFWNEWGRRSPDDLYSVEEIEQLRRLAGLPSIANSLRLW